MIFSILFVGGGVGLYLAYRSVEAARAVADTAAAMMEAVLWL